MILDVKQLNKIMKPHYFYTLKALWDNQGKIKMYYGMSSVKKQLSGKRSIDYFFTTFPFKENYEMKFCNVCLSRICQVFHVMND